MDDNAHGEEGFLDFCESIATDDGFFTKRKRRNATKKEWRALDPITKRDIMTIARAVDGCDKAVAEAKDVANSNFRIIARLPKRSRIRRLKYLDPVETAILNSIARCNDATRQVNLLIADLGQPHTARTSLLPQLLQTWTQQADSFLVQEKQSLASLQRELHALKRRTPGRKTIRDVNLDDMAVLSRKRVDKPPALARPPPVVRASNATTWHCRDLATGLGAMNKGVHISIGTDGNGVIVDRTVRKTVLLEYDWDWCGSMPKEFATQAALSGLADARFVLRAEEWPEECGGNLYNLYLEFAPHGDLFQLANNHREANQWVPEDFLWLLFQALIESALLMKIGSNQLNGPSPPDWQEIVHRDLKPENVVLGLPVKGHFQMYPRPKLADFGGAIFTSKDDPVNPEFHASFATPGLTAPEQHCYIDPQTGKPVDRFPILSPCNVWGIAAIMYNMMTLGPMNRHTQPPYAVAPPSNPTAPGPSTTNPSLTFDAMDLDDLGPETPTSARPADDDSSYGGTFRYTLPASVKNRYDPELCDVVNRCMNFHPAARPTVEELKVWLEGQFGKKARLRDLRGGRRVVGRAPEVALCRVETEGYKLGLRWGGLRGVN